jgi:hypothetical protein
VTWSALKGPEFEEFLRQVFIALGYEVTTTGGKGDQGVDLVLEGGLWKVAVQAKGGYEDGVDNSAVQAVNLGKIIHKCDLCAVITNGRFRESARAAAEAVKCVLIHAEQIPKLVAGEVFPPCNIWQGVLPEAEIEPLAPRETGIMPQPGMWPTMSPVPKIELPTPSEERLVNRCPPVVPVAEIVRSGPLKPRDSHDQPLNVPTKEAQKARPPVSRNRGGCVLGAVFVATGILGVVAACGALGVGWSSITPQNPFQVASKGPAPSPGPTPPGSAELQAQPTAKNPEGLKAEQAKEAADQAKRDAEAKARQEADEREKAAAAERLAERRASAKLHLIRQLIDAGRIDTAKFRLEQLIRDYPKTEAAEEARQILKKM